MILPFGKVLFTVFQESDTVIGDQVSEIVRVIVILVLHLIPVEIHRVVVEAGVLDQPHPFPPPRGDVRPIVFVQVLAKVSSPVPSIVEVGSEGPRFVGPLPVGRGTVIVVGVHMVVVGVHPGQEGAAGGTAHGGRDKRVIEVDPLVSHYAQGLWHDFHRTCNVPNIKKVIDKFRVYGSSKDTSTQGVSGLGWNDLPPFIKHKVIHRYTVCVAQYRHRSWLLILWPISNSNGFRLPN